MKKYNKLYVGFLPEEDGHIFIVAKSRKHMKRLLKSTGLNMTYDDFIYYGRFKDFTDNLMVNLKRATRKSGVYYKELEYIFK